MCATISPPRVPKKIVELAEGIRYQTINDCLRRLISRNHTWIWFQLGGIRATIQRSK